MNANASFQSAVHAAIEQRHLLKHPFYQAWTAGKLTQPQLKQYAIQYFHHVLAEPTYLSAVHANTPHFHTETVSGDLSVRQAILDNLIGEEQGEQNHPALWKTFAFSLGATEQDLIQSQPLPTTTKLIDTIKGICRNEPFYAGLAALHAFESQVPEVATTKIDGLQKFYGFDNPADYAFFSVHQEADVHHSQTEWALIDRFANSETQQAEVLAATTKTCDALLGFLDGVYAEYCQDLHGQECTDAEAMV